MWKLPDCSVPLEERAGKAKSRGLTLGGVSRGSTGVFSADFGWAYLPFLSQTRMGGALKRYTRNKKSTDTLNGTGDELTLRLNEMSSDLGERQNANGRDTVTGTDTNTETTNTSTLASTADAFTAEPAARGKLLRTIPLNRGDYEVCEEDLARDASLYPGVDVLGEY